MCCSDQLKPQDKLRFRFDFGNDRFRYKYKKRSSFDRSELNYWAAVRLPQVWKAARSLLHASSASALI